LSGLFTINGIPLEIFYLLILERGLRIAFRAKVNDCIITGLRIIDSILPVGRGQRQLILGDRYTGKTTIFISLLLTLTIYSNLFSIDGFGSKRLIGILIGINQNLSKLTYIINSLSMISFIALILTSHSSSTSLLSFMIPLIGISLCEKFRENGSDLCVCFDNLSNHSKSYRQISLLLSKIPSRDAFPADIFNIHSSLLERCGKIKIKFKGGSITGFPIIETMNSDITEFITTNIISITDGQFYTNKRLFFD
jgi:F-type H+-transporting ATPase subunit alpha